MLVIPSTRVSAHIVIKLLLKLNQLIKSNKLDYSLCTIMQTCKMENYDLHKNVFPSWPLLWLSGACCHRIFGAGLAEASGKCKAMGDIRRKWFIGSHPILVKGELTGISSQVLLDYASMSGMVSHKCPKLSIRELRWGTASLHLLKLVKAS